MEGCSERGGAAEAEELLDAGDVSGAMRHLRFAAEKMPVGEPARVVGRASAMMGSTRRRPRA